MGDLYVCQYHRPGTCYISADLAVLNLAGISEEAGAACHKRPASKSLPPKANLNA